MRNNLFVLIALAHLFSPMAHATEVCGQMWKINTCGINGCPLFTFTAGNGPNTRKVRIGAQSSQAWNLIEQYANSEREVCLEGALSPNGAFIVSSLRAQ
jgi:hypothetical protein